MFECNKLPVKATTKTTRTHTYGGIWATGYGLKDKGSGAICTHINLLLLSLCQWAAFEVRCRHGNKTNTNDKAETEPETDPGTGTEADRDGQRDRGTEAPWSRLDM